MEKTIRITLTVPKSIKSTIDKKRKDISLSRFVTRVLEEKFGTKEKDKETDPI